MCNLTRFPSLLSSAYFREATEGRNGKFLRVTSDLNPQ